jgi:hypothetical protein
MARSLGSEPKPSDNAVGTIDGKKLLSYRDRIASLMSEQKGIGDDIRELAKMCSDEGLASPKHIRKLARESLADQEVLRGELASLQALRDILGEFGTTPLGEAAISANGQTEQPRRGRRPKAQSAIEAAQAHLDAGGDFEDAGARIDADLQRIIDEHPPS